jgi:hypothetical protein
MFGVDLRDILSAEAGVTTVLEGIFLRWRDISKEVSNSNADIHLEKLV